MGKFFKLVFNLRLEGSIMKHLQDQWDSFSVQIAQARIEKDLQEAELRRVRELEQRIGKDISELEAAVTEAQKTRSVRLRAELKDTASKVAERSRFYTTLEDRGLFDLTIIEGDKEAITLYEGARAESIKRALQLPYQQALQNQAERQKLSSLEPIDAGVVLHRKDELKCDIYLTALTNSTGSLVSEFITAVRNTVEASGLSATENNVEDLLRITVQGDYHTLVQELQHLKIPIFQEAGIQYDLVILGESREESKDPKTPPDTNHKIIILPSELSLVSPDSGPVTERIPVEVDGGEPVLVLSTAETFSQPSDPTIIPSSPEIRLETIILDPTEGEAVSPSELKPSLAQRILGDQKSLQSVITYGSEKVDLVVGMIISALGEDRAEILFTADKKDTLFKQPEHTLSQYVGRLNNILSSVDKKYGTDVPSDLSFEENPGYFFPAQLSAIERKIESASLQKPKSLPSAEVLEKIQMSEGIARGLMGQGYDPVYVYAILVKGFELTGSSPRIGERYFPQEYWIRNYRTALTSLGVPANERVITGHVRLFKGIEILSIKDSSKQEHPLSFSPRWAERTSGALNDYLSNIFSSR